MTTEEKVAIAMEMLRQAIEQYIGVSESYPQAEVVDYVRAVGIASSQARADIYRTLQREAVAEVWRRRYGRTAERLENAIATIRQEGREEAA